MKGTDIQGRVFKKAFWGYSPAQVRDFLDALAREVDLLNAKAQELQEKLDDREERCKRQQTEMLDNARKAAVQLITETEKRAAKIVSAADGKREEIEISIGQLKHQRNQLRRSIQQALALQKDTLEILDSQEPEEKFKPAE